MAKCHCLHQAITWLQIHTSETYSSLSWILLVVGKQQIGALPPTTGMERVPECHLSIRAYHTNGFI